MSRNTVEDERVPTIILLECGRTLQFSFSPPKNGEPVWCSYHTHYVRVKDGRAEYRVRCLDCRYSRSFGAARETANRKAIQHARRAEHRVEIRQGAKVLHEVGHVQDALAFDDDPPF